MSLKEKKETNRMSKKLLEEGTIKRWKKLAGLNEGKERFRATRGPQTQTSMEFDIPMENGKIIRGRVKGTQSEVEGPGINYKFVLEDGTVIPLGRSDAFSEGNDYVEDTEYNFGLTGQGQRFIQSQYMKMQADKDEATRIALDKDAEDRFNDLDPDTNMMNQ